MAGPAPDPFTAPERLAPSTLRSDRPRDLGWLHAVILGVLLVSGAATHADTDLWGHVRFGQALLSGQQLPPHDPYAFTSDRPWINHEWLAEAAMGAMFDAAGVAGLLALKMALLLVSLVLVSSTIARRAGFGMASAFAFGLVGLTGVLPLLVTLRPQAFSVLLFAAVAAILSAASPRLWVLPVLFGLWANLHGGWIMGLGALGAWITARMALAESWRTRGVLAVAGATAVAATLVTPYGWHLWAFVHDTVGFDRSDVAEWQSLLQLPELAVPWAMTTAIGVWAVVKEGRRAAPAAAACLVLAVASFRVARMVPFHALAVGMLLLPALIRHPSTRPSTPRRWMAAAATGAALIIIMRGGAATCWAPAAALQLDSQAHAFIRANDLAGKLVVWFDWGEYVIWHFPGLSVSMDGRRETVYSSETLAAHQELYRAGPGARAYLDRLAPDYVWLPTVLPASGSMASWGWRTIFDSGQSRIWTRHPDRYGPPGPVAPACFPGP